MGYSMNMFIIFLVVSLAMNLVNPSEWGSPLVELITYNSETGDVNLGGIFGKLISDENIAVLLLSVATGVVAGLFLQDATYGLFAGFVTFMLGYALVPIGFFADANIPFFIKMMVGVPLAFMYIFSLLGWYRGVEL